jgi:ribulose-5-phosphate 4-epimerase/fuculose-1-phosphate aldolase
MLSDQRVAPATRLDALIVDLIAANKILSTEEVVDAFGHVSVRHPDDGQRYLMTRARAPRCVDTDDVLDLSLDGRVLGPIAAIPYSERFVHGALYEARADIAAVVHSHSKSVIPFGVGGETIRPLMHSCAVIGYEVPIWDSRETFGDTDLLVSTMEMGRDLARTVGSGSGAMMRGHGFVVVGRSLRHAVYTAIMLQVNAQLQRDARRFKDVTFLSAGEVDRAAAFLHDDQSMMGIERAWEYWCDRAGVQFTTS